MFPFIKQDLKISHANMYGLFLPVLILKIFFMEKKIFQFMDQVFLLLILLSGEEE